MKLVHTLVDLLTRPVWHPAFMALSVVFALPALGQAPVVTMLTETHQIHRWGVENGLPVNHINDIHQASDGYMWLATVDGLVRFDGSTFTTFSTATNSGLPPGRFSSITEAPDGALWLLTGEPERLIRYAKGRFENMSARPDYPRSPVHIERKHDTLWVGSREGLFSIVGDVATPYRPAQLPGYAFDFTRDAQGNEWVVAFIDGITRIVRFAPDGTSQVYTLPNADSGVPYGIRLDLDRTGRVWAFSSLGAFGYDGEQFIPAGRSLVSPSTAITVLPVHWPMGGIRLRTSRGWVALRDNALVPASAEANIGTGTAFDAEGGIWHFRDDVLYRTDEPVARFPNNAAQTRSLHVANDGTVWIGSDGLYHLQPRTVQMLSTRDGLLSENVYLVFQDQEKGMWAGSWSTTEFEVAGLTRFVQGAVDRTIRVGLVAALAQTHEGTIWVGRLGPLCTLQGNVCIGTNLPVSRSFQTDVSAMLEDANQRLWLGTPTGLAAGRPGEDGWLTLDLGTSIRALTPASDGGVWVGSLGLGVGLARIQGGVITVEWFGTADGLASDLVRDIYEDERGIVWIATQDLGLCRLDRRSTVTLANAHLACLTTNDGLYDNSLHRILPDDLGRLWMNTNRGLFWVERNALDAFAQGQQTVITSVSYTERDGMQNREGNGGRQPAGARAPDGTFWFPTQAGIAIVDPAMLEVPTPPRSRIEEIITADSAYRVPYHREEAIRLAADERDLSVHFTALDYRRPGDVIFRSRLVGYNETWTSHGASRSATFTNLPARTYRFEVQAGIGGQWSEVASVVLRRPARYWETWWFYVLIGLAGMGLMAFGYQLRVRQLRRRQLALEATVEARTTELKKRNARIEEQAALLVEMDQAKTSFIENISHEFRTPLTLSLGVLDDLLAGTIEPGPSLERDLAQVARNNRVLLRLVNQLLDVARMESKNFCLLIRRFDVAEHIQDLAQAFVPLAEKRAVTFHRALPRSLQVWGDPDQVELIVTNLLSNAFKFTNANGTISLTLVPQSSSVVIRVRDTGRGIPETHLSRIFERFYQVDESHQQIGTGIGLSLVKELIDLHGGQIEVASTPSQGTTFTVTLPTDLAHFKDLEGATLMRGDPNSAAPTPLTEEVTGDAAVAATNEEAATILVVDDNPEIRALVQRFIGVDYNVQEAENGAIALQQARLMPPDLILSDVMMPIMNGFELIEKLRADAELSYIPVLLLTAKAEPADQLQGLGLGADDYLIKPFQPEELRLRVRNVINRQQRLRERLQSEGIASTIFAQRPSDASSSVTTVHPFIRKASAVVEQNLADETFGVEVLATALSMDRTTLYRHFNEAIGIAPSAFIRDARLELAARLFREQAGTVGEVAYAVGFKNTSHFGRLFKVRYDETPAQYARRFAKLME